MNVQPVALWSLVGVLAVAIALATYRLLRGPSLPDRVVALDLLTAVAITLFAAYAMLTGEAAFLDAALVLALVAFLGTVAFARHLERRRTSVPPREGSR